MVLYHSGVANSASPLCIIMLHLSTLIAQVWTCPCQGSESPWGRFQKIVVTVWEAKIPYQPNTMTEEAKSTSHPKLSQIDTPKSFILAIFLGRKASALPEFEQHRTTMNNSMPIFLGWHLPTLSLYFPDDDHQQTNHTQRRQAVMTMMVGANYMRHCMQTKL